MNIIIRVDASSEMGIGHLMRCLTLANALVKHQKSYVKFVCRHLPEALHNQLLLNGHDVALLTGVDEAPLENKLNHSKWLGVRQRFDALETISTIGERLWQWLIVDHYGIDEEWQSLLRPTVSKIMVIDDLSDRTHNCDLLLDQTYQQLPDKYLPLVPKKCHLLLGTNFSLLRPEFKVLRAESIKRRKTWQFENLLITMGGADIHNATLVILKGLLNCKLPENLTITVVLGSNTQDIGSIAVATSGLPCEVHVIQSTPNLASLMVKADLVIGAAGTTSWERCCLGVPSVMAVLAKNQELIANSLHDAGAAVNLGYITSADFTCDLKEKVDMFIKKPSLLEGYSNNAASIVDGRGVDRVLKYVN